MTQWGFAPFAGWTTLFFSRMCPRRLFRPGHWPFSALYLLKPDACKANISFSTSAGRNWKKEYPLRFPGKSQLFHSIKEEIRKVKREKERASGKIWISKTWTFDVCELRPATLRTSSKRGLRSSLLESKKGYSPEKKKKSLPRDLWLQRQRFRWQVSDYGLQMPECQRGMGWDMEAGRRLQAGQMQKRKKGKASHINKTIIP